MHTLIEWVLQESLVERLHRNPAHSQACPAHLRKSLAQIIKHCMKRYPNKLKGISAQLVNEPTFAIRSIDRVFGHDSFSMGEIREYLIRQIDCMTGNPQIRQLQKSHMFFTLSHTNIRHRQQGNAIHIHHQNGTSGISCPSDADATTSVNPHCTATCFRCGA